MEKQEKLCELQVSPSGVIAWGIEVTITEDGNEIAKSVNRTSICPDFEGDQSALPNLVQQAIAENWTPESIEAYKASLPTAEDIDVEPDAETVLQLKI